jgi:ABC-2 type transport system ATP-binding protein
MAAIEVTDLRKTYGSIEAVAGVSITVAPGEVYGLLGHNGAGKSTTVEILEGHRSASSGTVSVLGLDPSTAGREYRDRIGIVLQASAVEKELTVREALRFYGSVYRQPRAVDDVIEMVDLAEKADARIGTLSGGQRRRIDLALGIIGNPEVLFLDEPTTGFDPAARRQSWQLIQRLCDGGTTVLLTTHYLDEAEQLADRVGVLANGRLVAEGTPAELMASSPDATITFDLPDDIDPDAILIPADATYEGRTVRIETPTPTAVLSQIAGAATAWGIELDGLSVRRPSLEDVFLRLGTESEEADT